MSSTRCCAATADCYSRSGGAIAVGAWRWTTKPAAHDRHAGQAGDTMAMLPLSDLVFGLSFDASHAHFTFPEAVTVINAGVDADGMPTMEELEELAYAYTYDPISETGAIVIDFNTVLEMTGVDGNVMNVTLMFHRNI